ncbi:MAG: MCP four helix bundle domain-containing protein, partial [Solirubrobacteraceae bacterium]|nr:MCP four helix bundle domain-containing protein [Solirubrobacteraceae bacterium]
MNFGSLRLATRLSLAFGVIVLLSLLASAFSIYQLKSIHDTLETVVNDNDVRIRLNQQMSEQVHVVSRVMRSVVLLSDDAARGEERKKIVAARASYDTAR